MAREFVMGVKLALNDQFFPGISPALRATEDFRATVEAAEGSLQRLQDASRTALQGLQAEPIRIDAALDTGAINRVQEQMRTINPGPVQIDAALDAGAVQRVQDQLRAINQAGTLQAQSLQITAVLDAGAMSQVREQLQAIRAVTQVHAELESRSLTQITTQIAAVTSNILIDAGLEPGAVTLLNAQIQEIRPRLNLDIVASPASISETESRLRGQLSGLDLPLQVAQATIQQIRGELRTTLGSVDVSLDIDRAAIAAARNQLQALSPITIQTDLDRVAVQLDIDSGAIAAARNQLQALSPVHIRTDLDRVAVRVDLDSGAISAARNQLQALSPVNIRADMDSGGIAAIRSQLDRISAVSVSLDVDGGAITRLRSQLSGMRAEIDLDVGASQIARLRSLIQSRLGSIEIRLSVPTIIPGLRDSITRHLGAVDLRLDIPPLEIARIRAELLRHDFVINPRVDTDAIRRLQRELNQVRVQGNEATRSMGGLRSSVMGIGAAVGGGFAVKGLWDGLVGANADMETYQNTLGVILKSQDKAAATLKWASTFAATTPFEIPEVVEATTKMAAYGIEAQKVLGVTGDMASVMGKSLDQAVEAIADAQTGELERLKEFGITKAMVEAQGAKMGATLINKSGQITDQKAFNAALFSLMEERYGGGMEIQSKTFKGMLSNAQDFIGTFARDMGKPVFDKLKVGLGDILKWAEKVQTNGQLTAWMGNIQRYAGIAWNAITTGGEIIVQVFKGVSDGVQTAYGWIKWIFYAIAEQAGGKAITAAKTVGDRLVTAFKDFKDAAQPILQWLIDEGLPAVQDALVDVGVFIVNTAAFFTDNWSTIKPFIEGLVIAFGTYYAVTKTITAATKIWAAVQLAWNAVMTANPIGLIIVLIGLLIGAVILLVRNWDQVSAWLLDIWNVIWEGAVNIFGAIGDWFVKWGGIIWDAIVGAVGAVADWVGEKWAWIRDSAITAFTAIGDFVGGIWDSIVTGLGKAIDGIKAGFTTGVQFIVDILNGMIDKINSALDIKLPDWLGGKEFAISIPNIPDVAPATDGSHATGLTRVPFDGYTATLHQGEQVLTAAESRRYDTAAGFTQPMLDTQQLARTLQSLQTPQAAIAQAAPVVYNVQVQEQGQRFTGVSQNENLGNSSEKYEPALRATQEPKTTPKQAQQINIQKLVEKIEIVAAPGVDASTLMDDFINELHRRAKEAVEVLSVGQEVLL